MFYVIDILGTVDIKTEKCLALHKDKKPKIYHITYSNCNKAKECSASIKCCKFLNHS